MATDTADLIQGRRARITVRVIPWIPTSQQRYRPSMRRNRYCGYLQHTNRGYLVAFDLQWNVIEQRRVNPLQGAAISLADFIREYECNGWKAESDGAYGFVFMNREDKRILLEVTPRDPCDTKAQSYSPFKPL